MAERDASATARGHRFQVEPARVLRSHVVLRSRFAEDSLRDAAARGITQYVLLGAGLDTFPTSTSSTRRSPAGCTAMA